MPYINVYFNVDAVLVHTRTISAYLTDLFTECLYLSMWLRVVVAGYGRHQGLHKHINLVLGYENNCSMVEYITITISLSTRFLESRRTYFNKLNVAYLNILSKIK